MKATFGDMARIPPVAEMVTRFVQADAPRGSLMYTGPRAKQALLAQIVGSVLIEMNLQHPNGASGGIYPQKVFQMNDERMYARLDAAIQFLDGAQPLALTSYVPIQYMGKHATQRSYVRQVAGPR